MPHWFTAAVTGHGKDESANVLETAGCLRQGHYAVAVMPARSALACHSRAAAVVS